MEKQFEQNNWNMVSEVELIYKSRVKASQRPQLKRIDTVSEFLRQNWDENKMELVEQFKVLCMSRTNRVLALFDMSTGGVSGTVADPKIIFMAALKLNAHHLVIAHNHPSGNSEPSSNDIALTKKIRVAAELLDMYLLDHIILTAEGYYSFANEGLL